MSKPAGVCVFCGRTGVSAEHLFSDWLEVLFPRAADLTHTIGEAVAFEEQHVPTFETRERQGHSGTRTHRIACERCNNEWMSAIDEAGKAATPLIQGKRLRVTPEMQTAIATWLTKIAMVGDNRHRDKSTVTQEHRDWLRECRKPPPGWYVWVGPYVGTEWRELGLYQHSGRLTLPDCQEGYLQITVIGMGSLLAVIASTDVPNIELVIEPLHTVMRRIWPASDPFEWPTGVELSDDHVEQAKRLPQTFVAVPTAKPSSK